MNVIDSLQHQQQSEDQHAETGIAAPPPMHQGRTALWLVIVTIVVIAVYLLVRHKRQ